MTKYGRLIVNTRPGNVEIYLDGQPVLDSLGIIAKSPTIILNVSEGIHNVTFSKDGYNDITVMVNVREGFDSDVKAILNTSQIRYPMMLSAKSNMYHTCSMLNAAIEDEFKAILEYSELLEIIEDQYTKNIKDILEDETEHYVELKKIAEEMQCSEISSQSPAKSTDPPITLAGSSAQPAPGWPALPIPQIPYGHLVANTIPDDAEIFIDGQAVFGTVGKVLTTPASILGIVVGKHTVSFRKKGYSDTNIDVFIENGLYSDAYAVLRPIMIGSKPIVILGPANGEITVDTTPGGAKIYIDSKLVVDNMGNYVRTPVTLTLNEGYHDLGVYIEKHCREFGPVYVYPNAKTYVHRDLYGPPCE